MMIKIMSLVLLLSWCSVSVAHPVIWKDGKAFLTQIEDRAQDYRALYSVSHRWAIGSRFIDMQRFDKTGVLIQSNGLIKRWNQKHAQGNVYALGAIGQDVDRQDMVASFGLQADWENRRVYTAAKTEWFGFDDSVYRHQARVGIAPYIGDFDDLHTWIILQADRQQHDEETVDTLMPVIRVFYKNVLGEIGSRFDGSFFSAMMIHI